MTDTNCTKLAKHSVTAFAVPVTAITGAIVGISPGMSESIDVGWTEKYGNGGLCDLFIRTDSSDLAGLAGSVRVEWLHVKIDPVVNVGMIQKWK